MEDKKKEDLQSRREFFKSAAKTTLPVIGAVVLSALPIKSVSAANMACSGCTNLCTGCTGCSSGCTGCTAACGGCTSCTGCTGCSINCYGSSH